MTKFQKIALLIIIILAAFLRFYKIESNPPGLYWDETVFGYDAYSILKSGKDHHGNFLPLFFESFGDWKLPVYHYLLVPSIAVFGLNEFAVRFPSALLGTLTIPLVYLLTRRLIENPHTKLETQNSHHLTKNAKDYLNIPLFTSLMLAISPWHIQFSRAGFESTVGLFFITSGVFLLLVAFEKPRTLFFFLSSFFFILSMYSYHAYRIFTPLLIVFLIVLHFQSIKKNFSKFVVTAILSMILLLPLIIFTFHQEGRSRAITQSAYKKSEVEAARLDYDQKSKKPLRFLSKYLYNEPLYYSYISIKNYVTHFSPIFLFIKGDQVGRHSQVDMGQLYPFEAILIIAAFFVAKYLKTQKYKIIIAWLLLAPIPAIIVSPSPHAYRSLQMVIPLAFLSGLGAYYVFAKGNIMLKLFLICAVVYSHLTFLHLLFVHYPRKFAADWQDGYREMVSKIEEYQNDFDNIYVTNISQVPYIYLLFYQKYDPQKFITEGGNRDHFYKYYFVSDDINLYDKGPVLYVAPSWKKVDGKWLAAVNDFAGRHLYSLWEIPGND